MFKSGVPVGVRTGDVIWKLDGVQVVVKDITVSRDYREKETTWKSW